jgi:Fic family protein
MKPLDFKGSSAGELVLTTKGYWAFIPAPLPPKINWSEPLLAILSEADRALAKLAGRAEIFPYPHILAQPFIHREAVLSSRIEGTRTSVDELYAFEAVQLAFVEDIDDAREVQNYVRAFDYALKRLDSLPISLRMLWEMHAHLMEGVRGEEWPAGEFRRSQNWIGSPGSTIETATYVPPPVDEMHLALDQLEGFIHSSSKIPPLVRVGLIHYQFEAIHPFLDGNGRVGRLLALLLLCAWDLLPGPQLYLSGYFQSTQGEYYDRLLNVSRVGDWEGWLEYFLLAVSTQSRDALYRIAQLERIHSDYMQLLMGQRAGERLSQVLDLVFRSPILTIRIVERELKVPYMTAQRYVRKFESWGILREITGGARNRVYQADEILKAIDEPLDIL